MGKYNYGRIWAAAYNGEKLPRKAKKMIFGKHVSKTKIKLPLNIVSYSFIGIYYSGLS